MNKGQKKILILIVIFLFIIILLLSCLFLNNKRSKNENIKTNNINDTDNINLDVEYQDESNVRIEYEYEPINNSTTFFTVKSCMEKYINNIIDEEYDRVYELLDKKYINNNNITISNIMNKIDKYNNEQIIISQMYELKGDNIEQYSIKYYIINKSSGRKETKYAIVTFNCNDFSFSITPIKDKLNSIKNIKLDTNRESIEKNNNNQYEYLRYTDERVAREYYEYYNMLLLYVPEDAYDFLNTTYKQKKFGNNYEKFIKYIADNKDTIQKSVLIKYSYDTNKKNYLLTNNTNNTYSLTEKEFMNFEICLDTYTVTPDYFNELTDKEKIDFFTNEVINQINYKQYEELYKHLNNQYKLNNMRTIEELQKYINTNMFKINYIDNYDISEQSDYYITKINLSDSASSVAQKKEVSLIFKILDNDNFEMAFAS